MQINIVRIENGYIITILGLAEKKGQPLIMFAPNWLTVTKILEEYRPEEAKAGISGDN